MSRQIDWNALVNRVDPDHQQKSQNPIEYEFSSPGGGKKKPEMHENGLRVFRGLYRNRGAYSS